jgi:hypothetical protein
MFGCRTIALREFSIANVFSATEQLTQRIKANDKAIAQAAALHRREQFARLDLLRVSREQRSAVSVAGFLRRLEYAAAMDRLTVISVTPSTGSQPRRFARNALVPLPVVVLVRGNFRAIVHFLQEITRQKSLTGIEDAQIVISPVPSMRATELDATVHLILYRVLLNVANVAPN